MARWDHWAIIASLALAGCSEKAAPPTFKVSIEHPYHPGTPALNMRVDLSGASRTSSDLLAVGEAVRRLGQALNDGRAPVDGDYRVITFSVHTDRPDPRFSGESTANKLLHITFQRSVLQQFVRDGANGDVVLGLASDAGWWTPRNDDVISDYCSYPRERVFCQRFFVDVNGEPR